MPELLERITIDPEVRSGKPVILGTRITVADGTATSTSSVSAGTSVGNPKRLEEPTRTATSPTGLFRSAASTRRAESRSAMAGF
jgi:hypothetical protein